MLTKPPRHTRLERVTLPRKVFVDTNIFVALKDKNDPTHPRAADLVEKLAKQKTLLFTSSDVVGETLTVLSRKLGKGAALEFLQSYSESADFEEIFIDKELHHQARELFRKAKPKNLSFVDCSSAIAMRSARIPLAFTFDQHFKTLGVKLLTAA